MLPGFRFLFIAIVLSMSVMIFGLGAASLLRSAHQEFASLPTRRAPPETMFSQAAEEPPRLAMLSIEARVPNRRAPASDAVTPPTTALIEAPPPAATDNATGLPIAAATASATGDDMAKPLEPSSVADGGAAPAETVAVVMPAAVVSNESPIAAAVAETTASIDPPMAQPPATPEASSVSSRIATLGGPAVDIDPPAQAKPAAAVRPRLARQRNVRRRRIAARSPQQAATQPADPFATPARR